MNNDKNRVFKWLLKVNETMEDSQLDKEKLKCIQDEVIKLRTYLGTDDNLQTYLFSIIFIRVIEDRTIDINQIMRYIDIQLKEHIYVVDAIDKLFDKKLLKVDEIRRGNITHAVVCDYTIRKKILQAILISKPLSQILINEQKDIYGFINEVSGVIRKQILSNDRTELFEIIENIENENVNLELVNNLIKMSLDIQDRTFLYELAHDYVDNIGRANNLKSKLIYIFGVRDGLILLNTFFDKQAKIQHCNLVELVGGDFVDEVEVKLTEFAVNVIFGKDSNLFIFKNKDDILDNTNKLLLPELFFDDNIKKELDFIEKITDKSNFQTLQAKLIEKGMTPGIVVLFFGEPGVGKSAVIRTIAKNTGRRIMEVSGSQKDKYYGETERHTSELFNNYNDLCQNNKEDFPIMVIDEADQLITRRLSNTADQTENTSNAQQNIILTALERNRGIIFLTTNMVNNMLDAGALERRINFKVEFKKPSKNTTKNVWKSNLSFLSESQIDYLNDEYSFTPAQINNIQKKVIFEEVIENQSISFNKVIDFCLAEMGIKEKRKSIGFNN